MYIHPMVRTQLYLDEEIHERLRETARRQGKTVSELVREALARIYGTGRADRELETLRAIAGLWKDRGDIGDSTEYVRSLRNDTRRERYLGRLRRRKR